MEEVLYAGYLQLPTSHSILDGDGGFGISYRAVLKGFLMYGALLLGMGAAGWLRIEWEI